MKTNRKENSKNKTRKENKNKNKTRRISGGKPKVITVKGYYKNGVLLYYRISHKMNTEQQQKYADKHKVFYSTKSPSILDQIFSIDAEKVKNVVDQFFLLKKPSYIEKYETIVVHDKDDIEKIETTNKIIANINGMTTISTLSTNYNNNLSEFIPVYKQFIETNKSLLLKNEKGMELLNTPIFLNIIGLKFGFITEKFTDLEKIKEEMDKPVDVAIATQYNKK